MVHVIACLTNEGLRITRLIDSSLPLVADHTLALLLVLTGVLPEDKNLGLLV
jgi:hypothetical protein